MSFTFITGGARSGKSSLALSLAAERVADPASVAFIATAIRGDDEMTERIRRHRDERPAAWTTYEEPLAAASAVRKAATDGHELVILDCVTLLVTNWLCQEPADALLTDQRAEDTLSEMRSLAEACADGVGHAIVVSNEVGMGIVPINDLARRFRDVAGSANQLLAKAADEVYLCASGIPIRIKGDGT